MAVAGEVFDKANAGDIEAMLELVRYYAGDGHDHGKAMEWSDKAADSGSVNGMFYSILCHNITALGAEAINGWDYAIENWRVCIDRISFLLHAQSEGIISLSAENLDMLENQNEDAVYGIALAKYMRNNGSKEDCEEILGMDIDNVSGRMRAIIALCLLEHRDTRNGYYELQLLADDKSYNSAKKGDAEQVVYCTAMTTLADIYRQGIDDYAFSDNTAAVETLNKALNGIENEGMRETLLEELGHYHKRLFGGYKYIE